MILLIAVPAGLKWAQGCASAALNAPKGNERR